MVKYLYFRINNGYNLKELYNLVIYGDINNIHKINPNKGNIGGLKHIIIDLYYVLIEFLTMIFTIIKNCYNKYLELPNKSIEENFNNYYSIFYKNTFVFIETLYNMLYCYKLNIELLFEHIKNNYKKILLFIASMSLTLVPLIYLIINLKLDSIAILVKYIVLYSLFLILFIIIILCSMIIILVTIYVIIYIFGMITIVYLVLFNYLINSDYFIIRIPMNIISFILLSIKVLLILIFGVVITIFYSILVFVLVISLVIYQIVYFIYLLLFSKNVENDICLVEVV